jgi:hypothetical protein
LTSLPLIISKTLWASALVGFWACAYTGAVTIIKMATIDFGFMNALSVSAKTKKSFCSGTSQTAHKFQNNKSDRRDGTFLLWSSVARAS